MIGYKLSLIYCFLEDNRSEAELKRTALIDKSNLLKKSDLNIFKPLFYIKNYSSQNTLQKYIASGRYS